NWEEIMVPVTNDYGNKINNYTKNEKNDIVHIVDVEQMLSDIFPEINDEIENNIQNIATFSFDKEKLVLVAEDSVVASKAIEKILTKIGAKHKMFVNGQLLLDYVNSLNEYNDIGLVITDLEMPVASGFTVIKELKRNPKTQKIPIVVNSSMSGKSNVDMAKSLNADGFMAKTKPNEIAEFVRKFLGN
ncbi:MAG: two-component system, chemotaxis family, chemotaxis protein CheV, partial [Campylobacterota bacterium]|nr:two-component system, chemotaxis family, chemotaxis protein CheV [Campylobacterota bacterium]